MKAQYIVTSSGVKAGKAYTTLSRIVQGTKESGDRYAFLDSNSTMREVEEMTVGTIVTYETTRAK